MKTICIICMRKGSSEVKNKNLKIINGKPLMYYTINQAIKSKLFDNIVVSTDSDKILKLSHKYGAEGWFLRPKKYANNKISKRAAIIHALKKAEDRFSLKYDLVIDLDVTSPLRKISDLKKALRLLISKKASNLISVTEAKKNPYFNMVEYKKNKINLVIPGKKISSRQTAPKVYEMNASIYIWTRDFLLKSKTLFGSKTAVFYMPQERSIDIDSNFDFKLVKQLIKN